MNTKERGDVAVGQAIAYYMSHGYEVCLPVGDKRHYDFVVEKDGILARIQVKYAGLYKSKGKCLVGLRITGGNQSFHYSKKYNDNAFDILFAYTERRQSYAIPWREVTCRNELTIETAKYRKYMLV